MCSTVYLFPSTGTLQRGGPRERAVHTRKIPPVMIFLCTYPRAPGSLSLFGTARRVIHSLSAKPTCAVAGFPGLVFSRITRAITSGTSTSSPRRFPPSWRFVFSFHNSFLEPPVARISSIHRGALLIIDVFATGLPGEESSLIRVSKLRHGGVAWLDQSAVFYGGGFFFVCHFLACFWL